MHVHGHGKVTGQAHGEGKNLVSMVRTPSAASPGAHGVRRFEDEYGQGMPPLSISGRRTLYRRHSSTDKPWQLGQSL